MWLNKCIAKGNLREFYAFLSLTVLAFIYSFSMLILTSSRKP